VIAMPELMRSSSPPVLLGFAEQHADRWKRLQEERRFRVEQLATLDTELAGEKRGTSVLLALRIAATTALSEIDAALVRMAEGTYGQCVGCAHPIPTARLDVLPSAPLCMQCHYNEQNCQSRRLEAWRE
jgi:RNA polymerase-binding transcription factor DksA